MNENRPEKLIELLKIEKKEDYRQYQFKMVQSGIHDRVREGMTWFPVGLESQFFTVGERITLEFRRKKPSKHAFQVGANVGVFHGENEERFVSGVVSYLQDEVMRVILDQPDKPEFIHGDRLGINLLFDDMTYREMGRVMQQVAAASNDRVAELRDLFYGKRTAMRQSATYIPFPLLNGKQNEAINLLLQAKDMGFVHGPPGTGKTITLVRTIQEVVRREKQVLVCAPSNAAVDLLVEKLVEKEINVLRIGHPARLTPEVMENSLDARVGKHPFYKELRTLRRKSDELKQVANSHSGKNGNGFKRKQLYRESKQLRGESRKLENYISQSLVGAAEVIACSLVGANHQLIKDVQFKTVFIDEATQAMEPACWIPMVKAQRVFMSGDHFQLPPTIKSRIAAKDGLETTLFEQGILNQPEQSRMLEVQYRMRPEIMAFSNKKFYQGKLRVAPQILESVYDYESAVLFIDTAGADFNESLNKETLSTYNSDEAQFLIRHLESYGHPHKSVAIIAPYKAQIEVLNKLIRQSDILASYRHTVQANTVDAFQGQERDVIYISLTRSNPEGVIGFLSEYRRLNVAITRAKERLVMVGDSATLGHDVFFREMIEYFQGMELYQSVFEFSSD